jgi:hypothetical protein
LSKQAAQLSYIPQGYTFRLSRQAAQLSFMPAGNGGDRRCTGGTVGRRKARL